MENIVIKQDPFWTCPFTDKHIYGGRVRVTTHIFTHIRSFEESKTRGRGYHGQKGTTLDLWATLTDSSDDRFSKISRFSDRHLTILGLARSGRRLFELKSVNHCTLT